MTIQPPTRPPTVPEESAITVPVTSAQRGLWLINELYPDSSLYNVFVSVRLLGPVDLAALESAMAQVVARHEVLRTTFPADQGMPGHRVAERLDVPLPVTDLTATPAADRADRARRLAQTWSEQPFDLGLPDRCCALRLIRLGEHEHLLSLALHHIVCDGQSVTVLFDELATLYARETGADPGAAVAPLTAQYRDYAVWQNTRGADEERMAVEVRNCWGCPTC